MNDILNQINFNEIESQRNKLQNELKGNINLLTIRENIIEEKIL